MSIRDGLLAVLPLDETSGTRFDIFGSYDFQEVGGALGAEAGKDGLALTNTYNSGKYLVNESADLLPNDITGYTLAFWLKPKSTQYGPYLAIYGPTTTDRSINVYMLTGGSIYVAFIAASGASQSKRLASTIGTYYRIVLTYNPLDSIWRYYLNGALFYETTPDTWAIGVGALTLGGHATQSGASAIDTVVIANRPWTLEEVEWDYNGGLGRAATEYLGSGEPEVPVAPSGLYLVSKTDTTVTLGWTDNADNETSYHVQYATSDTFIQPHDLTGLAADLETHTIESLDPNTTYWFRVRCLNAAGYSEWSNVLSVTTNALPVASILEGLQATFPIIPHLSLTASVASEITGLTAPLPLATRVSLTVPVASEITGLTAPLPLTARASLTTPVASEVSSLTATLPLVPHASLAVPVASEVGNLTATFPLVSRVSLTVPVASEISSLTATLPLVPHVALTVPDEATAETLTGLSVALPLFGRMSATVPVASTVAGLSAPLPLPPHLSATVPTASTLSLKSVLALAPELSLSVLVASTMALSTGLSLAPSLQMSVPVASTMTLSAWLSLAPSLRMSVPVAGRLELLAALPLGVRLSFAQGEIITPYTTIRLDRDYYQVIALLQDYHQSITLLQDYYQALGII